MATVDISAQAAPPLFAIAAIVFAARNIHLVPATVIVTLPMLMTGLGVAIFAISVAIYGF